MSNEVVKMPLSSGEECLINFKNSFLFWRHTWTLTDSGYVFRPLGKGIAKSVYLHIEIAKEMGLDTSKYIDHKNKNPLDNREENLRVATGGQNLFNSRIRKDNKTGYKGVFLRKDTGRYRACIKVNGINIALGCWDSPERAYEEYKLAAKLYYGEFTPSEVSGV